MASTTTHFGKWGQVPVDGDVVPFSHLNPIKSAVGRTNRRHHFVSVVYMDGFTNDGGRINAYLQKKPGDPQALRPQSIGYERDYFSQKLPDGGQENHRFEDLWGVTETVWPATVRALEAGRMSPAISFNVHGMLAIMSARVPARRDRHALLMEAKLRNELRLLNGMGKLPAEYDRYSGELDTVPIGINPHETLLRMFDDMKEMGDLCFQLGFEVLHNKTSIPFLTSDNPVCSYDPNRPFLLRTPYDHSGEIELIFPITSRMLLVGSSKRLPVNMISRHRNVSNERAVRGYNRTIARFSYRMTLAMDRSSDDIINDHSRVVPTVDIETARVGNEFQIRWRHVFGPKPHLDQYIDAPEKAARLEARLGSEAAQRSAEPQQSL